MALFLLRNANYSRILFDKVRYFEIRTQSVGEMATLERIDMLRQLIKMFQRSNFIENTSLRGNVDIQSQATQAYSHFVIICFE